MNFHILLVHFPIALLTVYTTLEVVQLFFLRGNTAISRTKVIVLWIGAVTIIPTLFAGWLIHEPFERALPELLGAHMTFATLTAITFIFLALCYVLVALKREAVGWAARLCVVAPRMCAWKYAVAHACTRRPFVQLIAVLGFGFLLITGALGGALAHGNDVDPIVSVIYKLIVR